MTVTEVKHQAHLQEWREQILNCRGSGLGVKQWCAENHLTATTYYRWEREIFGKAQREKVGEIALAPATLAGALRWGTGEGREVGSISGAKITKPWLLSTYCISIPLRYCASEMLNSI